MNAKIFVSERANLILVIAILIIVVFIIGGTTIYNSVKIDRALDSHRTILVPFGLAAQVEVGSDFVSDDYLRFMARHITTLRFNYIYARDSARKQFEELIRIYHPDRLEETRASYYELSDKIEKTKNISSFFLQDVHINSREKSIEVKGWRRQYADDLKLDDAVKTYSIKFDVISSRFTLMDIHEKEGGH